MDVIFGMDRHVVIEDVAHVGDIEAARRHVARGKKGDRPVAEGIERRRALMLVEVPMQRADAEAMAQQRPVDDADILLAIAEDDGVLDVDLAHQGPERLALSGRIVGRLFQPLHDGRRRGGLRCDFDTFGAVQEFVGEALDFGRHGRREEQRLPGEGEELADALDVGNETHVEHAVGLVDHQDLDAVQQQLAALEMVEQPARRGDHHIGAAIELAVLIVIGHPADQQRHGELMALAEDLEMVGDLRGQFAGGFQDQRPGHARPGAPALEPGQHRQHEGRGLAGSGLRDAKHVAAGDRDRDGFFLNGSGSFEARRFNGGQHFEA